MSLEFTFAYQKKVLKQAIFSKLFMFSLGNLNKFANFTFLAVTNYENCSFW